MPTYTLPGADRCTWVDHRGRVWSVTFPCTTDDQRLVAELRALGAVEQRPRPAPEPEPPTSDGGES